MTEDDIDFRGVLTDAAAAGFAGGEFDCVGVFAPFSSPPSSGRARTRCSARPTSRAHPRPHRRHAATSSTSNPAAVQKLVDAWYLTLDYMEENPEEATEIMADVGRDDRSRSTSSFAEGTTLFTRRRGARRLRGPATTRPRSSTRPS